MAKLPILMYHNVTLNKSDAKGLTIFKDTMESHFNYLKEKGYSTFHFKDLGEPSFVLPKKSVIITFDDVYKSQWVIAYPLLQKYGLKASFFVPFKYVNGKDDWSTGKQEIMDISQLKSFDESVIELGLHSYAHKAYPLLNTNELELDFEKSLNFIEENSLNVSNVLAYPYGKFPRKGNQNKEFNAILRQNNIKYALRIGNRINSFPFKNNFEIQRLDIKAEDGLTKFKRKLKWGSKLF
ncbi:polysaccharide deacetylase family protein [Aquimarina agarivorans]|uniref:polysaccharide deacetylase family protein n=1 Tax=Aquimarina agarivorans TaxID=980584 RepID=UPI000248E949|nr:polysaccharide deacetylase family protein [Aquimarina agarivorans]